VLKQPGERHGRDIDCCAVCTGKRYSRILQIPQVPLVVARLTGLPARRLPVAPT